MRGLRTIMVLSLAFAACLLLPIDSAQAVTIDDFNDNTKSIIWAYEKLGTNLNVMETNQRLEFVINRLATGTPPLGLFFAGFSSRFELKGDFDIRIDFRLLTWPAQNGVSVGIKTPVCGVVRSSASSGEFIAFVNAEDQTIDAFPTAATTGKLRLKRVGNTLTAYCTVPEISGQWHPFQSITLQNAVPLTVELAAGSLDQVFADQRVMASLDNFIINTGYLLWPAQ